MRWSYVQNLCLFIYILLPLSLSLSLSLSPIARGSYARPYPRPRLTCSVLQAGGDVQKHALIISEARAAGASEEMLIGLRSVGFE